MPAGAIAVHDFHVRLDSLALSFAVAAALRQIHAHPESMPKKNGVEYYDKICLRPGEFSTIVSQAEKLIFTSFCELNYLNRAREVRE